MNHLYLILLVVYTILPPIGLYFTLELIYQKKDRYGWHYQYLLKYLITLSFLPILFLKDINLFLIPQNIYSVTFLITTLVLAIYGLRFARKNKVLFFYIGGIYAAFMEEILYRGVILGLVYELSSNFTFAIILSSLAFGGWHLKNYGWHKDKKTIFRQFLYTAIFYGPIFGVMTISTGDIYLAVLFHYIIDATVALAPDWTRGWLVHGGRKNDMDNFDL